MLRTSSKGLSILYTLAASPSLGGSRQHKRKNKNNGVSLSSSSNDEGSSRVWMSLLEQHSPSSPVFHNLRRFIGMPSPLLPLPQGCLYKATPWQQQMPIRTASQSFRHSFLFLARSLASLISILLSFRALFTPFIHPNLGLPLGNVSPVNFLHSLPFSVVVHQKDTY